MRKALFIFLVSIGCQSWAIEPLNYQTLLLLQTDEKHLTDRQWLKLWLSAVDPAKLRKMERYGRADKTEKELNRLSSQLQKRKKLLSKHGVYIERSQSQVDFDEKKGGIVISSVLKRYLHGLHGKSNDNLYFKRNIYWLLLNPWDELTVIPYASKKAWQEWYDIRKIKHGTRRANRFTVRYFLKPGRMVQDGVIEFAISGYEAWVNEYGKKKSVFKRVWNPDMAYLRKQNPLSEGFSFDLAPIHSLMIDGMALGEWMVRFEPGQCKEKERLEGRRVFVCEKPVFGQVGNWGEFIYVDGQMVRMRYFRSLHQIKYKNERKVGLRGGVALEKDSNEYKKQMLRWAQKRLNYPDGVWKALEWRKGRVVFRTEDFPDKAVEKWLFFEATHGKAMRWLGEESYQALP